MSAPWRSVQLDEVETVPAAGVLWRPLRRMLDVRAFGINAYVATNAGDDVVERHTESRLQHEEIYVVLAGRATFTLDDDIVDAPAGTLVFVRDPGIRRHARAEEAGTTVLAVGGKPGEAYAPSAWEVYFYAERYRSGERWDLAIDELELGLAGYPDHPGILYSLACYESLDGRTEAALAHLQRAYELDPGVADHAANDVDLDAIRHLDGFPPRRR